MEICRINVLMLKYWYNATRNFFRILEIFYWPLMGILIWGFTTNYISGLVQNNLIINFFLGGAILWTFFITAQMDIGIFILEDIWNRNIFNLFASPMKNSELIISTALFGLIRCILSFIFLVSAAYLLYSFNILGIGIVYVSMFAFGLILFGWVTGIFILSLIFRFGMKVQSLLWVIGWLIQPLSAVFYPLDSLPVWVQKISLIFPTTYIFEGMRTAFSKNAIDFHSLILSFAINAVLLIFAYIFFERSIKFAKRTGMLTKFHE